MYVLNVKVLFMHLACNFCTTKAQIESIIHVLIFIKLFLLKNTSIHFRYAMSLYLKIPVEF